MKSQIIRISQADPGAAPAPAPTPDIAPPPPPSTGMPSPTPSPMGGSAPTAPSSGPTSSFANGLPFPLENLGMILIDVNAEKMLKETFSSSSNINTTSAEEVANRIWQMYGGNKNGGIYRNRIGERNPDEEADEDEIKRTKKTRWKRLPKGKTMASLEVPITLEDMQKAIQALSYGLAKAKSKEQPSGGGMMASNENKFIKIAETFDKYGLYKLSDILLS